VKIIIFGLTISSSWGNGHATLWRGLCKALIRMGHQIVFYERDVPYYAGMRDLHEIPGGRLELYTDWDGIRARALSDIGDGDVAIITSYCPDSVAATDIVLAQDRALRVFYDLDTPITLARLAAALRVHDRRRVHGARARVPGSLRRSSAGEAVQHRRSGVAVVGNLCRRRCLVQRRFPSSRYLTCAALALARRSQPTRHGNAHEEKSES
jgi:hypothetical protein